MLTARGEVVRKGTRPPPATAFRRHAAARDAALAAAAAAGMSHRQLALAFLLSPSRVGEILAALRARAAGPDQTT